VLLPLLVNLGLGGGPPSVATSIDVNTIAGGEDGMILTLRKDTTATLDIVIKHGSAGAANIALKGGADFTLDDILDRIVLEYDGATWAEISRSSNT